MDNQIKWLQFNGKLEDFPAWSTRFLAYMQTKGLYKTIQGEATGSVEEQNESNNTVWCYLALTLDQTSLLYVRYDCTKDDGSGDGAKAWQMLNERFASKKKPTVVSVMIQLAKIEMSSSESLDEYCIRCQQLGNRLKESGEKLSETLFNALVLSGLPERYEQFVVQEGFNPAEDFTELKTRLQLFEDGQSQRNGKKQDVVNEEAGQERKRRLFLLWQKWTLC